jgi:hypothetical protein
VVRRTRKAVRRTCHEMNYGFRMTGK